MDPLTMVTAMCRAADNGSLPPWAHWTCLDAPAPETPSYLRTDCTCRCHTPGGEAALPPVPEAYLAQVPAHRRPTAEREAQRTDVA